MLRLDDHWIWDFWLADDGDTYHLFHLQAPRSLGDPDLRHFNARVGHATSTDLHTWDVHGEVLGPGSAGTWDDQAIWTGSVVADGDHWAMLYTACSSVEDGLVQRIGLATSSDLCTWTRHPDNPLLEADPRWYELTDRDRWHDLAWRDPWVMPDPDGNGHHALVTARLPHGPTASAGVIGHAWSPDLVRWEPRAPLSGASGLGHLEVPQVVNVDGRDLLVYSYDPDGLRPDRRTPGHAAGSRIAPMDSPLGPVRFEHSVPIGRPGSYSNKVVGDRDATLQVLGFDNRPGPDHLTIADPTPLRAYLPPRD